ncbi:MAG: DNA gyrase inhibitor YacG [Rhodospirillales bacterium]|nr:DNA gyrase inhibitor YacG [Rhodospirillales bacterium]MDE2200452.1 DNA gyrase inhibitor YacG [Rhodospirillales bacterium]MDE2574260.1 DNA gyrase inhibitor YacG [Rhodospirillales bacterium]
MAVDAKPSPCPICGKPAHARFRPFCGARCAEIDLGRWFTETYVVPGGPPGEGAEDGDDEAG